MRQLAFEKKKAGFEIPAAWRGITVMVGKNAHQNIVNGGCSVVGWVLLVCRKRAVPFCETGWVEIVELHVADLSALECVWRNERIAGASSACTQKAITAHFLPCCHCLSPAIPPIGSLQQRQSKGLNATTMD